MTPHLRLWEPPLDDDEDDPDDEGATIDGRATTHDDDSLAFVSRYAVFGLCLVLGGMIAGAVLCLASQFVP